MLRGIATKVLIALLFASPAYAQTKIDINSQTKNTLLVNRGGTGAVTITGPIKGNGTSPFTAAAFADIVGLWTTCTGFLKNDGTCASSAATPAGSSGDIQINTGGSFAALTPGTGVATALAATANTSTGFVTGNGTVTLTGKTYDTAGSGNSFSINGVAVTANTGTGSVVRQTSPTITSAALAGTTTGTYNLGGTYTIGGTPTFPAAVVQLTTTQTLSGKTFTAPIITVQALSCNTASPTWTVSSGNVMTCVLNSTDITPAVTTSSLVGGSISIKITQASTPRAITWPNGNGTSTLKVMWPSGAPPTLSPGSGAVDTVTCSVFSEFIWHCVWAGNFS